MTDDDIRIIVGDLLSKDIAEAMVWCIQVDMHEALQSKKDTITLYYLEGDDDNTPDVLLNNRKK